MAIFVSTLDPQSFYPSDRKILSVRIHMIDNFSTCVYCKIKLPLSKKCLQKTPLGAVSSPEQYLPVKVPLQTHSLSGFLLQ